MIFNLPPICGLFPLLLYIVLAFKKGMHPLVNVSICAVVGAIMVKQPLNGLGAVIYESMGSFLARTYLIRYPGTVQGAILMGTGQMSPALVAAGRTIAAREIRKVGEDHSSPVVMKLAFGAYNKRFAPNRTAFDWLSLDTGNVDRYLKDPLCGENPTVGLFREMLSGIAFITKGANLKKMNMNTPILFISGAQDPVGDCGKGVERAAASFRRAGARDVTVKLYPELRHELLQEAEAPQVCEDLYQWLSSKLPKA